MQTMTKRDFKRSLRLGTCRLRNKMGRQCSKPIGHSGGCIFSGPGTVTADGPSVVVHGSVPVVAK